MDHHIAPLLLQIYDKSEKLRGCLAVDSFVRGKTFGGLRVKVRDGELTKEDEFEAKTLAREMTLKYGFYEIPLGGSKSVLVLPLNISQETRDEYFYSFGRQLSAFIKKGTIGIGQDMGMNGRDLYFLGKGAGMKVGSAIPTVSSVSDSGKITAHGVITCFEKIAAFKKAAVENWTFGIEGFGSVGSNVALYLRQAKLKVTAISTLEGCLFDPNGIDVARLVELQKKYKDQCILEYHSGEILSRDKLYDLPMNVLFPCAGFLTLTRERIKFLKASWVIAGANCAVREDDVQALEEKGVLYIPGFVANAGAVLRKVVSKNAKHFQGNVLDREVVAIFRRRIENLLVSASGLGDQSVFDVCVQTARSNIQEFENVHESLGPFLKRKVSFLFKER